MENNENGLVPVQASESKPTRSRKGGRSNIQPKSVETPQQQQGFREGTESAIQDITAANRDLVRTHVEGIVNLAQESAQIMHQAEQSLPYLTKDFLDGLRSQAPSNSEFFRSTTESAFGRGIDELSEIRDLIG
jgi:hypothetical protein